MLNIISKVFEETEYVIENMPSLSLKKLDDLISEVSARADVSKDETAIFVNWFISKSDDITISSLVENKIPDKKNEVIKQKVTAAAKKKIAKTKQRLQEERARQQRDREDRYSNYDGY